MVSELASFAAPWCTGGCGSGSTIGPDGALYVTDGPGGRVLRIDPDTGALSTFESGLPPAIPEVGIGAPWMSSSSTAPRTCWSRSSGRPWGSPAWSISHPPATPFFVDSGVQYALEVLDGDFVVTDGHHNRVLRVTRGGDISQMKGFGNIVPTGLEVRGETIYMGEAGPIPHLPQNGKVVSFTPTSAVSDVASGASLIVDVELGPCDGLYALSQGIWDLPVIPENEGAPASADTGRLLRVKADGSLAAVVDGLDRPTSMEFAGRTAVVATLTGKVMKIEMA